MGVKPDEGSDGTRRGWCIVRRATKDRIISSTTTFRTTCPPGLQGWKTSSLDTTGAGRTATTRGAAGEGPVKYQNEFKPIAA